LEAVSCVFDMETELMYCFGLNYDIIECFISFLTSGKALEAYNLSESNNLILRTDVFEQ